MVIALLVLILVAILFPGLLRGFVWILFIGVALCMFA